MTTSKAVPLETDLAIRRLIARYCHLVDDRDHAAAADLFTADGRLRILEDDMTGPPAMKAYFDKLPQPMFHHASNVVVSCGSQPGTFHAISDVLVGGRRDSAWGIWMLGRYHDTFVETGSGLRYSQRIFTSR